MAKIIGLTGLSGAGKDTFALGMEGRLRALGVTTTLDGFGSTIRYIAALIGFEPYDREKKEKRVLLNWDAFSDKLFDAIEFALGGALEDNDRALLWTFTIDALQPRAFDDAGTKYISISPREFMQVLGTEGGQSVRKSLWVDLAVARWRERSGVVLVTDFRFMHEAAVLEHLVCICRPGVAAVAEHVSEHLARDLTNRIVPDELREVAVSHVNNAGTLDDLRTQAAQFANSIHRAL